ncbi:hypothetical protein ACLKA6_015720 [Drosophila palustris]
MFIRKGMQIMVTMVLLGLVMGQEEEELRAVEPNRVVFELPSINFTRLYNDINLINVYNKLVSSMKGKPSTPAVPAVPDVAADEPMKSEQPIIRRQSGIQRIYLNDLIRNRNPSGQTVDTLRQRPVYGYHRPNPENLYAQYSQQYGLTSLTNVIPGLNVQQLQNPYSSAAGYNFGSHNNFGSRPSLDSLYAEYNQKYGLASLSNIIPGLRIQEIPYSQLSGVGAPYNYYNLINNRPYYQNHNHNHNYHHHQGYGSPAYQDRAEIAAFRRWLISRYGQRGSVNSPGFQGLSGQEDIVSYQDDYLNGEVDDFADGNGDDFGEGDDFGFLPLNGAEAKERTALPLLFLLTLPQLGPQVGFLPGIPIRRPQDELTTTTTTMNKPTQLSDELPQSGQNDLIREQFIQGVLQGLQSMGGNGAATIQPAVLADFLEQLSAGVSTTVAPKITPPTVEKEAQAIDDNDNEADYDYIDFKNGSRIKYDLDSDRQSTSDNVPQFPNKILVDPQFGGYFRSQRHVI